MSDQDPLNLIQADRIAGAVIQHGGGRRLVGRNLLRMLNCTTILQISGDLDMARAVCYKDLRAFPTRFHDPQGGALMLFGREGCCQISGCLDCPVPYAINDGLRSLTRQTQRRAVRAIAERHYVPGAIGCSRVTRKTHFFGFALPDIPKPIHARGPGLSMKLWKPLTPAFLPGTVTRDPRVGRARAGPSS